MHKTAEEHIALAESILEQVENSVYYETHEKALECVELHMRLAESILHMKLIEATLDTRSQEKPEKPKYATRGVK